MWGRPLGRRRRRQRTGRASTRCAIGYACQALTRPDLDEMTVRGKRHVNATRAHLSRASDVRRPVRRHPVRGRGCDTHGLASGLRAPALLARRCRMRVRASDAHPLLSRQPHRTRRHPLSSSFASRDRKAHRGPKRRAAMTALRSVIRTRVSRPRDRRRPDRHGLRRYAGRRPDRCLGQPLTRWFVGLRVAFAPVWRNQAVI